MNGVGTVVLQLFVLRAGRGARPERENVYICTFSMRNYEKVLSNELVFILAIMPISGSVPMRDLQLRRRNI